MTDPWKSKVKTVEVNHNTIKTCTLSTDKFIEKANITFNQKKKKKKQFSKLTKAPQSILSIHLFILLKKKSLALNCAILIYS